jgi:hypothetical protein
LAQDCGATLSERVLLHNDAALLGLDFVNELAVEHQVGDYVPVVIDLDLHEHVPEPSALAGGLSGEFRKLCSSCAFDNFDEQGHIDFLLIVFGITYYFTKGFGIGAALGTCFLPRWDSGQG